MGTQVGATMAAWLASNPGLFRHEDSEKVLMAAYRASPFSTTTNRLGYGDFKVQLRLAGYQPQMRGGHSGVDGYWVLCLPEKQAGSR